MEESYDLSLFNRYHNDPEAYLIAVRLKRLSLLKLLYAKGVPVINIPFMRVCNIASLIGDVECLKFAHTIGFDIDSMTMFNANHSLECVEYLHSQNCPWDSTIYHDCILPVMKYAHSQNCPWD
jgi:hypothetical protein